MAAEQQQPRRGDPPRPDVSGLTAEQLERARRDLQASLTLSHPDSPLRRSMIARLGVISQKLEGCSNGGVKDETGESDELTNA